MDTTTTDPDLVPVILPVPTEPTVVEAWAMVMDHLDAVGKNERNTVQNYSFRGIDAVMNAVGPVFRAMRVFVIPVGCEVESERYLSSKGAQMRGVTVMVTYRVYGPRGDFFDAKVPGEASDSGDKAVPKAMSVAYRTFLLQGLTLPTDERDPDMDSHERGPSLADVARDNLLALCNERRITPGDALAIWVNQGNTDDIRTTDNVAAINKVAVEVMQKYTVKS